jgi:hypothetical protein
MFESAVRQAFFTAIKNDYQIDEKVTGVYEYVPQPQDAGDAAKFPYIVIGDMTLTPFDTDTDTGAEATITIHTWSRYHGRKEVSEIHDLIYAALHRRDDLTVSGTHTLGVDLDMSDTFLDSDGMTWHGVQRYRIIVEIN